MADITNSGAKINSTVDCAGALSCYNSKLSIQSGNITVYCHGDHACSQSNISIKSNYNTTDGYISYVIDNVNVNVSIELSGYFAGYSTLIICHSNISQCNIKCYGNACYNTQVRCLDNDTTICNIDCSSLYNDQSSVYCARMVLEGESQLTFTTKTIPLDLTAVDMIDVVQWTKDLDNYCSRNVDTSSAYDDYQEIYLGGTISSDICCRGEASCEQTSYLHISGSNGNVICSGKSSCKLASSLRTSLISGNGSIICNGYESCTRSKIRASEEGIIYCGATNSCHRIEVLDANGKYLYCTGGKNTCSNATIQGIPNVYLLSGYGNSNLGLVIDSDEIEYPYIMNVSLLAYHSGHNIVIRCNLLDICNIFVMYLVLVIQQQ